MASRIASTIPSRAFQVQCSFFSPLIRRTRPQLHARCSKTIPTRTAPRRPFSSTSALLEKKYTEDHEWVELSPDGKTGTIGITTYAAKALGDVVFVELPAKDLEVGLGDAIGAVESVKSAADINTPISGKIMEVNNVLQDKPGTINKGPETTGWIAKVEVKDTKELDKLMDLKKYEEFTEE